MNTRLVGIGALCCSLIAATSITAPKLLTAQATVETTTAAVTLPVGSIFEIIPDHSLSGASYSWNLTQDDIFVQATREQSFRVRLIKQGTYELKGEIKGDNGSRELLNLNIFVRKRLPEDDELPQSSKLIVETDPMRDSMDRIVAGTDTSLIRIVPNPNNVNELALDFSITRDTDRDGNPANDNQAEDTFFSTKSTPLHVWLTSPVQKRNMLVFVPDNADRKQLLSIRSPSEAAREDQIAAEERLRNREISVRSFGGGTVGFGLNDPEVNAISDPLLLHWNFGDGQQSMLDKPVHSYARSNQFTVEVTVRNLATGDIVKELSTIVDVNVDTPPAQQSSSSSMSSVSSESSRSSEGNAGGTQSSQSSRQSSSDSSEPQNDEKDDEGGSMTGIILTILGITVASILVGFFGMYLVSFLRKKLSLQGTLSKLEKKLTPDGKSKNEDMQNIDSPPPLTVDAEVVESSDDTRSDRPKPEEGSAQAEAEAEARAREEAPNDPPPQPPSEEAEVTEETPAWLAGGIQEAQKKGQSQDSPPPTELQGSPVDQPPQQAPTPQPQVDQSQQPQAQPQPQPQQPAAPQQPPAQPQQSQPQPQQPVTPQQPPAQPQQPVAPQQPPAQPQQSPAPQSQPAPQSVQTQAPNWLAGGLQQADQEGQTQTSPPPSELADKPPTEQQPQQPAQQNDDDMPDWLKAGADIDEQTDEAAASEPVPDWLNQSPEQQQARQQSAPAPQQPPQKTPTQQPQPQSQQPVAPQQPVTQPQPQPQQPVAPQQPPAQPQQPPAPQPQQTPQSVQTQAPNWLAGGLQQADQEGQTQTSPPPSELADTPPAEQQPQQPAQQNDDDMPDWLKAGANESTSNEDVPIESASNQESTPQTDSSDSNSSDTNQENDDDSSSDESSDDEESDRAMSKEEKERERKRRKRRRYRENKKRRKSQRDEDQKEDSSEQSEDEASEDGADDSDVQFIVSADSVAENKDDDDGDSDDENIRNEP